MYLRCIYLNPIHISLYLSPEVQSQEAISIQLYSLENINLHFEEAGRIYIEKLYLWIEFRQLWIDIDAHRRTFKKTFEEY